jgi:hypothetical protein
MLRLCFATLLLTAATTMTYACQGSDPPVRSYHARGMVMEIAGSGRDRSITIHHEAIPGFVSRDGAIAEMPSMKMTFGAANEVPSELLEPGTKLGFDFDVRWSRSPALWIVHAEALPSDAQLTLTDGAGH